MLTGRWSTLSLLFLSLFLRVTDADSCGETLVVLRGLPGAEGLYVANESWSGRPSYWGPDGSDHFNLFFTDVPTRRSLKSEVQNNPGLSPQARKLASCSYGYWALNDTEASSSSRHYFVEDCAETADKISEKDWYYRIGPYESHFPSLYSISVGCPGGGGGGGLSDGAIAGAVIGSTISVLVLFIIYRKVAQSFFKKKARNNIGLPTSAYRPNDVVSSRRECVRPPSHPVSQGQANSGIIEVNIQMEVGMPLPACQPDATVSSIRDGSLTQPNAVNQPPRSNSLQLPSQ